ncbi:hypothetical protein Pla100_34780 [Neorhodopirellula pilleata]|uniref:Uncharacterized protein n=1 Tax=Neorhodopirellula pilleata TaxID=2714738 RepID=A0A5C6A6B8_9BACT|nr:hypothetical protein Pla100_34780 [Neorhodopirellula pilleata]
MPPQEKQIMNPHALQLVPQDMPQPLLTLQNILHMLRPMPSRPLRSSAQRADTKSFSTLNGNGNCFNCPST